MPTLVIIGAGPGRGEQDYRQSDVGDDRTVDELMRREDRLADEAARKHDKGLGPPAGLQRTSGRRSRRT